MKIIPSKTISWQFYEDCVYIQDERNGQIRCLDKASVPLWKMIEEISSYDEILSQLHKVYSVSKDDLEEALLVFIHTLQESEIVEILE